MWIPLSNSQYRFAVLAQPLQLNWPFAQQLLEGGRTANFPK